MARPPPLPLQHEVAAAVRGARQGGAEVTRIKIAKRGDDIEIELETTLAPQPAIEEPEPLVNGLTPLQRRLAEHAQKIR
jgi:hypothetical protein